MILYLMSQFIGEKLYRMTKAAERLGVTAQTVKTWIYSGKLHTLRTVGGEHRIPESEIHRILGIPQEKKNVIVYSRVSTQGQKDDLETQGKLLEKIAVERGFSNIVKISDIGSGLNQKRRGLLQMFKMVDSNDVDTIIVNYKDRLTRFGFDYLASYFKSHGVSIIVINETEIQDPQKELVDDLIAIVTSFSGKIYGMRSNKAKKIVKSFEKEVKERAIDQDGQDNIA
jgi:excisionase family DNA binding protein